MPERSSTAVWEGDLQSGNGTMTIGNNAWTGPFSFKSRFEDGKGTNPEELLAAAHAGCFTMKLSFVLGEAGFTPDKLETTSHVNLENGVIAESHLTVKGKVPGISKEKFEECVKNAEENCPVSKALHMKISSEATLEAE